MIVACTAQKMKFSIKDSFSKYDQIRRKQWIWSHLPKKSLMENFAFCAVLHENFDFIRPQWGNVYYKNVQLKTYLLTLVI